MTSNCLLPPNNRRLFPLKLFTSALSVFVLWLTIRLSTIIANPPCPLTLSFFTNTISSFDACHLETGTSWFHFFPLSFPAWIRVYPFQLHLHLPLCFWSPEPAKGTPAEATIRRPRAVPVVARRASWRKRRYQQWPVPRHLLPSAWLQHQVQLGFLEVTTWSRTKDPRQKKTHSNAIWLSVQVETMFSFQLKVMSRSEVACLLTCKRVLSRTLAFKYQYHWPPLWHPMAG